MKIQRNNLFFMLFGIIFMSGQMALGTTTQRWGLYSVIPYLICFCVFLLFLKKDEATFFEVLPYNVGLKPLTALLIIALAYLMIPLTGLLSQIGAIFGGDMLEIFTAQLNLQDKPFPELLFELAVVPAVFEELYFRGILYAGFKKARGAKFAIIFTAILFGFFHMNLQQLIYAAVLGVVIGIIREATGSMWAGVLYHFINNGRAAMYMAVEKKAGADHWLMKLPIEKISFISTADAPVNSTTLILSWIAVAVCTVLAIFVLRAICKQNGRDGELKKLFKREDDPKERVVTAPLVIGCIVYFLMTALILLAAKLGPAMGLVMTAK